MKPFAIRATTAEVSAIKRIAAEAKKTPGAISLSQGIPSFSTPEHIRKGVAQALLDDEPGIGKYSVYMGTPELRTAIAQKLTKQWNKTVVPEELFVSAGGMEGLLASILALVNPGEEAIVPSPDYGPHFQHLHLADAKVVLVPLDEQNDWSWDPKKVEVAITAKTKLLLLTNPGNPAGNVLSKRNLEELAAIAKKHDLWVLVDETYDYLTYDDIPFTSAATIPDFDSRLIISRTFSKEYAMTGWRLGFIYSSKEVIDEALKMHDPMVIAAATPSQKAGLIALTGDQSVVTDMVADLEKRRNLFCGLLDSLKPHLTYIRPKGAYYVFARVSKELMKRFGPTSEEFAFRMLREAKVAAVAGSEFKPEKDEYIRFSFAGEEEEMKEAVRRIKEWINK